MLQIKFPVMCISAFYETRDDTRAATLNHYFTRGKKKVIFSVTHSFMKAITGHAFELHDRVLLYLTFFCSGL
jgi:hypothetical protein